MSTVVKFGTDGWRGIIADDFTYANVRVAARAIAHYVLEHENAMAGVCVGYDTRFGSRSFAGVAAEVLSHAGIPVFLANKVTPTPELSFAVRECPELAKHRSSDDESTSNYGAGGSRSGPLAPGPAGARCHRRRPGYDYRPGQRRARAYRRGAFISSFHCIHGTPPRETKVK